MFDRVNSKAGKSAWISVIRPIRVPLFLRVRKRKIHKLYEGKNPSFIHPIRVPSHYEGTKSKVIPPPVLFPPLWCNRQSKRPARR